MAFHLTRTAAAIGWLALAAVSSQALAALVISTAPTQNVTCSAGTYSPTQASAVLNVNDLVSLLQSSSVSVTSTASDGIEATDVELQAQLAWRVSTLSLSARRAVIVDQRMSVHDTGDLSIAFDKGGAAGIAAGPLAFGRNGRVRFSDKRSRLFINGHRYQLVDSIAELAAKVAANDSGAFALTDNYDAAADGTYARARSPTVWRRLRDWATPSRTSASWTNRARQNFTSACSPAPPPFPTPASTTFTSM